MAGRLGQTADDFQLDVGVVVGDALFVSLWMTYSRAVSIRTRHKLHLPIQIEMDDLRLAIGVRARHNARLGVQAGTLSTPTGSAASHEDLDNGDVVGEADQDRGQSNSACQVRHFPDGGGGGAASFVPSDSGTNTTVRQDADLTSANVMVAEASIPSQPLGSAISVRIIWVTSVPSGPSDRRRSRATGLSHTFWTNADDFDWRHRRKALRCCSGGPAAEPGKGQMGNMRL